MNTEKNTSNAKRQGRKESSNVGQLQRPESNPREVDATAIPVDRMIHYQDLNKRLSDINHFIRTGECPECEAKPVGCSHRAGGDMFCRACGHRWRI